MNPLITFFKTNFVFFKHELYYKIIPDSSDIYIYILSKEIQNKVIYKQLPNCNIKFIGSYIPIENIITTALEDEYDFDEFFESSNAIKLKDKHPYYLQHKIEVDNKIAKTINFKFELFQNGPTSYMKAISWRNRPKNKFWALKKIKNCIISTNEYVIQMHDPCFEMGTKEIEIKLSHSYFKRYCKIDLDLENFIQLQLFHGSLNEIINTHVKYSHKLKINNINYILKCLVSNQPLYKSQNILWPSRLQKHIFRSGNELFMLENEKGEITYFVTVGEDEINTPVFISNINKISP